MDIIQIDNRKNRKIIIDEFEMIDFGEINRLSLYDQMKKPGINSLS